jgi:16S rRNA (cytosine967-C5)-methyltransferase
VIAGLAASALAESDPEAALTRVLRAHPELDQPQRARLSRWVLGTSCFRRRLAFHLCELGLSATPQHLVAAYRALIDHDRDPALPRFPAPRWPEDPVERLGVEHSLPDWLARLFFTEQADPFALAAAFNQPGPVTLRANLLRNDRQGLLRALANEGIDAIPAQHAPHAVHLTARANLWGSRAWRDGSFEVQDEGSQLIAEACAVRPGERWLDLCAGNGGKSLALAAQGAQVLACDVHAQRLANLQSRSARAGASIPVRVLVEGQESDALRGESFDGVLVDAPCSELGTLRRHPGARWRISEPALASLPALQLRLLTLARTLCPQGKLVYATCSLRRAENEAVVAASGLPMRLRTLRPDREGTDGFFIAVAE